MLHNLNNHWFVICFGVVFLSSMGWLIYEIIRAPIIPDDEDTSYRWRDHHASDDYPTYEEGIMHDIHKN